MTGSIKLHVWGDFACFTRPEMKVERVSYDVITPTAARGILEAIHWKPAIRWEIERLHVLAPIRFQSLRRNEVGARISDRNAKSAMTRGDLSGLGLDVAAERQQRATMALVAPAYVIEARPVLTEKADPGETIAKHREMFLRRAERGQCFHRPCLGCREFAADFELVDDAPPHGLPPDQATQELGWMLYDIDYGGTGAPSFFRARLDDGVIDLANLQPQDIAA